MSFTDRLLGRPLPARSGAARLRWPQAGYLALGAWALVVGVLHLGSRAWQVDEPVYRNAAQAYLDGNWSHNLEHPLLGKLLIAGSQAVFGNTATAARLPAALAGLVGAVFLALLAERLLRETDATAARLAGLIVFGAWALLPHPDPGFDVTRLAYLDGPMTALIAASLYALWRWQEVRSMRWALATGTLLGLATATKLPAAAAVLPVALFLVLRGGGPPRAALRQAAVSALAAIGVFLLTYAPLWPDLPRVLRFTAAMQTRDPAVPRTVDGVTFTGHPPPWTQVVWQFDDWAPMALAQVVALALAWWVLPRRAVLVAGLAAAGPFVAFMAGARILPHWMIAWQVGSMLLLGMVAAVLVGSRGVRRVGGALLVAVVAIYAADRTIGIVGERTDDAMRIARIIAPADRTGQLVVVGPRGLRIDRTLTRARPIAWSGLYHSAGEAQHAWVSQTGGAPGEPSLRTARERTPTVASVSAIVAGPDRRQVPFGPLILERDYREYRVARWVIWVRRDLIGLPGNQ